MKENTQIMESAFYLLQHCGSLRADETCLILCDPVTRDIAEIFVAQGGKIAPKTRLIEIASLRMHGEEPPAAAAQAMAQADLIVSLCQYSLAHSRARIDAGKEGARFLSMPMYTMELMSDPAVTVDYHAQQRTAQAVADFFTQGSSAHVTSAAGTDIRLTIAGRTGNCCPGFVKEPGDLGSPPDIEANVSPVELESNGVLVIDGSITCPEIGLVTDPVRLQVEGGRIVEISSPNPAYKEFLEKLFEDKDSKRRILAECGVGLNPAAKLTGTMLTDEGALGCLHFGFGSNHTVGGTNQVAFHLDFVFQNASLSIDGREIIKDGVLASWSA
ncbi:2,5-dihydroxypyridine 5,6-dioxygenase [Bradyrhizobium sp. LB12.1]|jgi:2,5-dihydroxypyridine 5,6-dioxygenase|uniref:aminopeptidase n=1 Tax=Bradyrhizobium sp. LB12.1 TaxID=3156327 RepID=UPI003396746B